ncbi:sodium:proton antiporter [Agromyces rhizosphaerae]|uniref:Sodium:proton antiporter n=1 Tax=Agromyces rhizosphaerae TaxID=88374 RepID=A0A9W6FQL0_9MICO|nr:cation:proton antiporter [Agromyces rhizosphaerae]GLI26732.1 sodium:proton antiporter [Agromyces rhizosphaerae]
MIAVIVVLVAVMAWSALSRVLDRRGVTAALFLAATGLVVGLVSPLSDIQLDIDVAERVAEIALVLLLFSDATRLDLRALRHQLSWPTRLLLIGLPLTMLLGFGVGLIVFPGMALASVALLAVMLAPTDAALGQKVVTDDSVPPRVRQALDVESGLNDGLSVPVFLVALSIANAEIETGVAGAIAGSMAAQIGWGLFAGVLAGLLGGALIRFADERNWITRAWRQVLPLAAALLAFAVADELGGSGFIAAFVGGIVFGRVAGPMRSVVTLLTEEVGELAAAVTWLAFGALALVLALPLITWQVVLYAVLSLTVVRMIPVAIALAGGGIRAPTIAFIGWFGPRGLASLVFVLIAASKGVPEQEVVLTTVLVTVALSILLHGLTSVPLVARYHRWSAAMMAEHPSSAESVAADMPRARRQLPRH